MDDAATVSRADIRPYRPQRDVVAPVPGRQDSFLGQVPACLLDIDLAGDTAWIVAANARAAAFYGQAPEALHGHLHTLYEQHAAELHRRLLAQARSEGLASLDTVHISGCGERIAVRLHAQRNDQTDATGIVLAVEDISAQIGQRTLLEAIDEDRRRIAHELHDTVAQNLAAIRMEIGLWKDLVHSDPDQVADEMDQVLGELKSEIERTRQAIFALRPVELDQLGFWHAVRKLVAESARQYGFAAELAAPERELGLAADLELPLLRILQEALNNAGRHAGAGRVRVALDSDSEALWMCIEDDGGGFAADALFAGAGPGHYGLLQMRERVRSIGGVIDIDSRPGHGTRVSLRLAPQCA